ncbi:MAG: glycosyltransferase family 2 protein [Pirellulales bacterium]|nr:glycosyltransferase family 2 protein [Pirellulales bacterium]
MEPRFLTALPVYNEANHVSGVLAEVRQYSPHVLVVDDGSSDGTSEILDREPGIHLVRHAENQGYGAALISAFRYAIEEGYDTLVTIDCDGQHEPKRIPRFVEAARTAEIVSGSRYLKHYSGDSEPPAERRRINGLITAELNRRLGLELTDGFCGFKAYRVEALKKFELSEVGYAMPLEVWVQAAHLGLRIVELPVPLIYLDEARSFGGALDDGSTRMQYYHLVLDRSLARVQTPDGGLWQGTLRGEMAG